MPGPILASGDRNVSRTGKGLAHSGAYVLVEKIDNKQINKYLMLVTDKFRRGPFR